MSRANGRKNPVRMPVPGSPEGDEIGLSERQDPSGSPIPGLTGNIVNYQTVRQRPAAQQPDETFDEYRGMMAHGVPNDSETTGQRASMVREGTLAPDRKSEPELHRDRELPAPVPVYITTLNAGGRPLGTMSTAKITVPASTGSDPVRIATRNLNRTAAYAMVETAAGTTVSNPSPSQPAVPATGVAQQNLNSYPVQVVISANGATITNVSVNGITVGTAAGTYTVPANGAISIAYSVATPTWVWSYAGANVLGGAPTGIRVSTDIALLSAGFGALLRAGMSSYQKLDNMQEEMFALSNDGSACTLSMIFLYGELAAG